MIIFKTKFGSHLYGTNTPTSDDDYKGVYIASYEDIILKKDRETIHNDIKLSDGQRNTAGDSDYELIELRKFIKDAMAGQTYALDMLFATEEHWELGSPTWRELLSHREKLLSRNVKPYIGYCRQQAGKYGLKGSRLGELLRVISWLQKFDRNEKIYDAINDTRDVPFAFSEFVYVEKKTHVHIKDKKEIKEDFLCVLGKYFSLTRKIGETLDSLELMDKEYGERARKAEKNDGVDWKAISHAYRCCFQLIELALKKKIVFPILQAEFLKKIKAGKLPYSFIQEDLPKLMDKAIQAVEKSDLPDEPDRAFWDEWIIEQYRSKRKH